jgi:hypothetical protein
VCSYDEPHAEADAVSVPKRDHVQISAEVSGLVSCHFQCCDTAQ